MDDKKQLKQDELNNVSGGQGINNTIIMQIGLTFKFEEMGKELYKEIQIRINKRFTTKVNNQEIINECKAYCDANCIIYVKYEVISTSVV